MAFAISVSFSFLSTSESDSDEENSLVKRRKKEAIIKFEGENKFDISKNVESNWKEKYKF